MIAQDDKNPMQGYNPQDRNFQKTEEDGNQIGGNVGDNTDTDEDTEGSEAEDAVEDQVDPPLDEADLEENNLSDEEADKIEWNPTQDEAGNQGNKNTTTAKSK